MNSSSRPVESKALRLARYLREFVALRSTTIRDVAKYETVLWFGDMPQEPECQSPAWTDGFESGDSWLIVRKQQFPKPDEPPDLILPWIDERALKRATDEMPALHETAFLADPNAEVGEDGRRPLIEARLDDHKEVREAYESYRPNWMAWSIEHRRRQRIQTLYAELFRLHTQIRKQGEILEVVLGLGLLDWRNSTTEKAPSIRRHVVVAQVDVRFDPLTGVIRVESPGDGAHPRIEDDMLEAELRPERREYAAFTEQLNAIGDDIWDRSMVFAALRSWAEALHPDSVWSPSLIPPPDTTGKPVLSFAPALILRRRNQIGMIRVYESLVEQLGQETLEIPRGWVALVDDEVDDLESDGADESLEGTTVREPQIDPQATYFPLPANREQRRIVEALQQRRGVLVQGPPGTGKTHSIANLMCHLLATGQRVLITAETGRALKVLKNKLPEELRPLCVSLLGQGSDAFAELNDAVQGITTRHASYTRGAYDERIAQIDMDLDQSRRELAAIDNELRTLREGETIEHSLSDDNYRGTASTIASRVARERERFAWLRVPIEVPAVPPATGVDLLSWLRIVRNYSPDDIADANLQIIPSMKLPTPVELAARMAAERQSIEEVSRLSRWHDHVAYEPLSALSAEELSRVADGLTALEVECRELARLGGELAHRVVSDAVSGRRSFWETVAKTSQAAIGKIERLLSQLGTRSVLLPSDKDLKTIRGDAVALEEHFKKGGKWKTWGLLTPKVVQERAYFQAHVRVDGQLTETPDRFQAVCAEIDLRIVFSDLERLWSNDGGIPKHPDRNLRLASIRAHLATLDDALVYASNFLQQSAVLTALKPPIPQPKWQIEQIAEWLKVIEAAMARRRLAHSRLAVESCLNEVKLVQTLHDAHPIVGSLAEAVQKREITAYSAAHSSLIKIEATRRDQEIRVRVESQLRAAIPNLLDEIVASLDDDVWTSRLTEWDFAWRWANADNWLRKRGDAAYQRRLWQRRHDADKKIGHFIAESASLRAWRHFFARLSGPESAALKSWREAVRAMGKGTGKSAKMERLRREARSYMDQCREAIPVWIMPRYLVAEMVDPAPNRYDVIIIDEASQLGIESLFLFYIGKKMVVVGDDQQISPYGIGIADEAISNLQQHYLEGMFDSERVPHQHALSAQSSLYANAKIRFGQNIVLREHFRCMPEIIQFSNDLCYASNGTPLDPLRTYPPNRLQPVVVRHVPEGYREGSTQNAINRSEADALVAQIVGCIEDPRYEGLSMGVISLQGEAQAKLIEQKLLKTLEPEVIEDRQLVCGDAYAFQGDERHVIFLSMVAAPNTRIGVLSTDSARQRFNVAASRAMDQLWLFHTATLDILSSQCMRHRLLGYMLAPKRKTTVERDQRFDSDFEKDVHHQVSQRGFHVRTQVSVGDPVTHRYRIDMVIEGMAGRLAVECDGDKWHGPERYEQDMARQRDLERAGWRFVRIRGGDFYRDPIEALQPLWNELERLGITSGGLDSAVAAPPGPRDVSEFDFKIGSRDGRLAPSKSSANEDDDLCRMVEEDEMDVEIKEFVDADISRARQHISVSAVVPPEHVRIVTGLPYQTEIPNLVSEEPVAPFSVPEVDISFLPYIEYQGWDFADPRTAHPAAVTQGLLKIIEVEGPMVVKRTYDVYLRGCGIRRMGC